jgi:hypothetical protein
MIDITKVKAGVKLIAGLPFDEGHVTCFEKQVDNGDITRVWAIEFESQTLEIHFTFDDTIERERQFAQFVGSGIGMFRYFMEAAMTNQNKLDETMLAFRTVFNALIDDNQDLKAYINDNINPEFKEESVPTVGEQGD